MIRLSYFSFVLPLLAPVAGSRGWDGGQEPLGKFDKGACPDYALYATFPQWVASPASR